MSNSSLVDYIKLSPNRTKPRLSKIKKITIHMVAGDCTVETLGDIFEPKSRKASSNYGIGSDGRVGMYVEEKNRSWCSGSRSNDHQAITIEVANDSGAPEWHVSDKAMKKLIELCVDICKRNGIEKLNFTGDKKGNLTMHKWFQDTSCPGQYLESKFPYIAKQVNIALGVEKPEEEKEEVKLKPIAVDGKWGKATTTLAQQILGTTVDGKISKQSNGSKKYLQNASTSSWEFVISLRASGSNLIKAIQKMIGVKADGKCGKETVKALQNFLNKAGYACGKADGYMGEKTVKAWQKYLNDKR